MIAKAFAASVEVGHAWVIPSDNARTRKIEPQAQMIYSYLDQEKSYRSGWRAGNDRG